MSGNPQASKSQDRKGDGMSSLLMGHREVPGTTAQGCSMSHSAFTQTPI
jgi:hypothetical protein